MGPHGLVGATGATGATGLQGPAGSEDIHFNEIEGQIAITAPGFQAKTFTTAAIDAALENKANTLHRHGIADLSAVPDCATASGLAICREGALLNVGGAIFAPLPTLDGRALISETIVTKLGTVSARWNDSAVFDPTRTIVTLVATVRADDGADEPANVTADLRVRIRDGKIQEFHNSPTMGAKTLIVKVDYTRRSETVVAQAKFP